MATCLWCDKKLSDPKATTCPSCVFKSISDIASEQKARNPEGVDPNFDLSIFGLDKSKEDGKTKGQLLSKLHSAAMKPTPRGDDMTKYVKVKSRNIRNTTFLYQTLQITFDAYGYGWIQEGDVPLLQEYSRVRQGRIWVVEEDKKEETPEKPQLALKQLQPKTSSKKAPTKKAPAKKKPGRPAKKRTQSKD